MFYLGLRNVADYFLMICILDYVCNSCSTARGLGQCTEPLPLGLLLSLYFSQMKLGRFVESYSVSIYKKHFLL